MAYILTIEFEGEPNLDSNGLDSISKLLDYVGHHWQQISEWKIEDGTVERVQK